MLSEERALPRCRIARLARGNNHTPLLSVFQVKRRDHSPWVCRDIVSLVAARPAFESTCFKTWMVAVLAVEDRVAAAEAIELIKKSCVAAS
jgi:hypothetical protein